MEETSQQGRLVMGQMTFTDAEYANRKRVSKREEFLSTMDKLMTWDDWVAAG